MSSQKTEHYELNQWLATDQVLRTDFNADNAKIDAALAGKAGTEALESLASTVSSLEAAASQLASTRNCCIYTTSYSGDGQTSRTFTFPQKPMLVFAVGGECWMFALQGAGMASGIYLHTGGYDSGISGDPLAASWSGNNLTLSCNDLYPLCNRSGVSYRMLALLEAV